MVDCDLLGLVETSIYCMACISDDELKNALQDWKCTDIGYTWVPLTYYTQNPFPIQIRPAKTLSSNWSQHCGINTSNLYQQRLSESAASIFNLHNIHLLCTLLGTTVRLNIHAVIS